LRFLETQRFYRVGGSSEISTDVRVVAATNRCRFVRRTALREDLLYRLAVFPIFIPLLRERGDDVLLLATILIASISAAKPRKILAGGPRNTRSPHGPGNVESEECDRACVHSRRCSVGAEVLPVQSAMSA
jgi:transcriptional regulator with GAF, ATPase, and Fis domain